MALFPSGFTLSFDHWTTFWFFFSLKNKMCSITVCVYLHLKRQYRRGWSISIRWWVRMLHKPQLTFHFKLNGNNQEKKKRNSVTFESIRVLKVIQSSFNRKELKMLWCTPWNWRLPVLDNWWELCRFSFVWHVTGFLVLAVVMTWESFVCTIFSYNV